MQKELKNFSSRELLEWCFVAVIGFFIAYFLVFFNIGLEEIIIKHFNESPIGAILKRFLFSAIPTILLTGLFIFLMWLICRADKMLLYFYYILLSVLSAILFYYLDKHLLVFENSVVRGIISIVLSISFACILYWLKKYIILWSKRISAISSKQLKRMIVYNSIIIVVVVCFLLTYKYLKYGYV